MLGRPTLAMEESMENPNGTTPAAAEAVGVDVDRLRAEARDSAISEERARVSGIEALGLNMGSVPGMADLIRGCIADGVSVVEAQARVIGHMQASMAAIEHRRARAEDEATTPDVPVTSPGSDEPTRVQDEDETGEETLRAEWNRNAALRSEFMQDFETFRAYRVARSAGRFERLSMAVDNG